MVVGGVGHQADLLVRRVAAAAVAGTRTLLATPLIEREKAGTKEGEEDVTITVRRRGVMVAGAAGPEVMVLNNNGRTAAVVVPVSNSLCHLTLAIIITTIVEAPKYLCRISHTPAPEICCETPSHRLGR